jgi:hypothetical protein
MSWMISDNEADLTIAYLKELQKLKPSKELKALIKRFEGATKFNRGKEM